MYYRENCKTTFFEVLLELYTYIHMVNIIVLKYRINGRCGYVFLRHVFERKGARLTQMESSLNPPEVCVD